MTAKLIDVVDIMKEMNKNVVERKKEWQLYLRSLQSHTHTEDIIDALKSCECEVLTVTEKNTGSRKNAFA